MRCTRILALSLPLISCTPVNDPDNRLYEWGIYDDYPSIPHTLAEMGGWHKFHKLPEPVYCSEPVIDQIGGYELWKQADDARFMYQTNIFSHFFLYGNECWRGGWTVPMTNASYISLENKKDYEFNTALHELRHATEEGYTHD